MDRLDLVRARKPMRDNWLLIDERAAIERPWSSGIAAAAPSSTSPASASGETRRPCLVCRTPPDSTSSWARAGTRSSTTPSTWTIRPSRT